MISNHVWVLWEYNSGAAYEVLLDTYRLTGSRFREQKLKSSLFKGFTYFYLLLDLSQFPEIKPLT